MVPITELENGDLKIAPTGRKPEGWRAWLGENFALGIMAAAAIGAVATIFFAPTIAASLAAKTGAHWGISALWPSLSSWIPNMGLMAVGGLVGGYMSKRAAEKEAEEGITIEEPGYFNRGVLTEGFFKGGLNGLVLTVGIGVALIGTMLLPWLLGLASITMPPLIGVLGVGGTAIVGAIGAAIGAVRGSVSRKENMEKVYNQVKTAYYLQTGQVEKARGLMQKIGVVGPVAAAGVGVGAGMAAAGKAKVVAAVGAGTGLFDRQAEDKNEKEKREAEEEREKLPSAALAETALPAALPQNPYDFSYLEDHPALAAQRSFAQAELERRATPGSESPVLS